MDSAVIESCKAELHKCQTNFQKLRKQNAELALTNSQMLVVLTKFFLTIMFVAVVETLIYDCLCVLFSSVYSMQELNSSRQKVSLEMKIVGACVTVTYCFHFLCFFFLMMD